MTTSRITQSMLVNRSIHSMQLGLGRVSAVQEQITSGKRLTRPSDSPTDTASAMRLRSSLKAAEQYARNAQDGLGRLGLVDQTLFSVTDDVRRARELALQGANSANADQASREALATEVDQIRADLLDQANTTYLTRPVFGGVTSGSLAYQESTIPPGGPVTFVGQPGPMNRRVGENVEVRVDVDGRDVFGDAPTSVFDELDRLSTALRAGDQAGLQTSLDELATRLTTVNTVHAQVGAAYKRLDEANTALGDKQLSLTSTLSEVEDVDLAKATVDLSLQQVAYQAALSATAKVIQPSLLDFLR